MIFNIYRADDDIIVRVGADVKETTGKKYDIKRVFVHEKYSGTHFDIAVVELQKPLKYTGRIKPIRLPKKGDLLKAGTMVDITGYGITQDKDYKNTLQMVSIPIIDRKVCNETYYKGEIDEYMICAGLKKGGQDACQVSRIRIQCTKGMCFWYFRETQEGLWHIKVYCMV